MADHFAVHRLGEQRALVKSFRQRFETKRGEEALASLDHLHRVITFGGQQLGGIKADIAGPFRCDDLVDIAPFLGPHIAEQIGADRSGFRLHGIAIFLVELVTGVAVQLIVKRLDLSPQLVGELGKIVGRHVVTGAPHRTDIRETKFLCAFVGNFDHAGIVVLHRRADVRVPACPHLRQFFGVAVGAHCGLDIGTVDFLAVERALPFAVSGVQLGRYLVQFGCGAFRRRCRQHDPAAQFVQFATRHRIQSFDIIELRRFDCSVHRHRRSLCADLCRESIRVIGDEVRIDPVDPSGVDREVEQLFFGIVDKLLCISGGWRRAFFHRIIFVMLGEGRCGQCHGGDCDDRSGGFHMWILNCFDSGWN